MLPALYEVPAVPVAKHLFTSSGKKVGVGMNAVAENDGVRLGIVVLPVQRGPYVVIEIKKSYS